jgi:TetR/AcrR family transcriptional repressor of nem operon
VQIAFLKRGKFRNGCLIGNFSAEVGEHSEVIHRRLIEVFEEIHRSIVSCLKAAARAGDLPRSADCEELAHFLYASLQGAILQAKVLRNPKPLERFKKLLFETVLR